MSESNTCPRSRLRQWIGTFRRRTLTAGDAGQTAIVAVLTISLIVSILGVALVSTVVNSFPIQQAKSVQLFVNRALEAGENAYLTAINTNSSLAQCSTNTNTSGICSGIGYGTWNLVNNSTEDGSDAEYYAFGNPVPTFDPTSHTLVSLAVQVLGAARDASAPNGYLFEQETLTVQPQNGFLQNVWWSNYESYSGTGNYSTCNYNYSLGYDIDNKNLDCTPVYFGPGDYLFGPVFTNDSVFVSGNGQTSSSPSFGTPASLSLNGKAVPSAVTTADPNCLFVDDNNGMSNSAQNPNCAGATSDVALYDTVNSSYGNAKEVPPTTDGQLSQIANQNGCLYSGPTQITLSGGNMTVNSPDTPESTNVASNVSGWSGAYSFDTLNQNTQNASGQYVPGNLNDCPNNGTAPLPANGVVYVENSTSPQAWANPFDDPIDNSVTNLTSNKTNPVAGNTVILTATVKSDSNQLNSGATVTFNQTTNSRFGGTSTSAINNCSNLSVPAPTGTTAPYTSTITCQLTYSSSNTGAFSASFSGGNDATASTANLGTTYTFSPSTTYGPDSQVSSGGCSSCYYGETSTPDAEGDAFVQGSLSGQLTIATQNNVIVDGNITYADCAWTVGQAEEANSYCPANTAGATNDALGLIANNYAEVDRPILASTSSSNNPTILPTCATAAAAPNCDPSNGTNGITIDAAVLALNQSFTVNNYTDGGNEGTLTLYGSVQQYARGAVGTFSGNSVSSGYQKHYTWDPLLDYFYPPSYLVPNQAAWTLTSVAVNGGSNASADNVCPAIEPPFGYSQWITNYCAQPTPDGLPNYPALTAPTPPTNVTATASLTGTVTVNWTDPASGNATSYNVTPFPACSGCNVSVTSSTTASITGLTPGDSYSFTVTGTNSSGTSSPSIASNAVVIPGPPGVPTLVTATANANGSVSVNWSLPTNNGSTITGFRVSPSPACSGCSGTTVSNPTATSATITGLTGGGTYTFTVTATNSIGSSSASAPSNSVVVPTLPGVPVIGTANPANVSAIVTWTAPSANGSPITGYVVTPYVGTTAKAAQTFNSTATTETVTGLTNGTAYTFKVAAINGVGTGSQSAASNSVTPENVPGAPTIGTATASNASATVTWTAPASNGGSAITGYVVTPYTSVGNVAQTAQTFNSTATSETVSGLSNGTGYYFKVAAINIIGTGAQSNGSNSVTPLSVPGAPTIGTATAGNTTATVTWTAPSSNGGASITAYVVTPYIGGAAQTATRFNSTATTQTMTGLTNGTAYTFTVAAINSVGTGAQSAASNSVTPATVPGAPTIGTATSGNASATLTWTAPASNGGSAISGYVVTPYLGGIAQTAQTFNSTATTQSVTGLTNGSAYTFKVAAMNVMGTGAQSAASNSVTPMTVPGAPTMGTVTSGNGSVTINWTAPSSNGGAAITGYIVTPYIGGTAQIATSYGTATTETMTGLTNGTTYTFTVAAVNSVGEGAQSGSSSSVTPATVPGAPTIGTATAGSAAASATVSWTAPTSNGGAAITGYVVTPYISGTAQTAQTFNSTATTETLTGLTNTNYTFKVAAFNSVGTGAQSAASNSVTVITVPGAPTAVTATAANASANVTWTAPTSTGGSAITGYVVTPYIGGTAQTAQTFNSTATSQTVTGLTNGTAYTFKVAAINGVGTGAQSAASNSVTPMTVPGAPTSVTATAGNTTASVTWTAPVSNGGSAITGYVITPYLNGTTAQTAQTFNSTATTETVTGLTNGNAYTFTVAAINSVGTGAASAQSNSVTPATVPGAPTIGTATSGNASATLTWTAPVSNGGSAISGYVVTPYLNGTTAQTAQTFNSTATTEPVTGLNNGSAYTFKVAAINSVGTGAQSAASNSVIPATTPGAPTIGAVTSGNASVTVSWTAPTSNGGAAITGYIVTPYIGGTAQIAQQFNSTATTETATGLINGTAYTFTVAAINSVGEGAQSGSSSSVTPATTPGAPTGVSATGGTASATVTWTAPASTGGATITGYVVTPYIGGTAQTAQTFNSTATTETVSGLTNTAYTFTVAAINSVGTGAQSAASNSVTPVTVSSAPTIGTATAGNASATLTWTAPASTGGATITGYVVTPYLNGTTAQTAQTFNSTATSETVTGLTNGNAYTFKVAAINTVGTSAQSAASNSVTPATTPGAPTIGTATGGNASASLNWTAPASNGGSAITGYVVTPYLNGTTAQTAQTFNSTATTETVGSLTNGSAYTFAVAAINGVGTGPQSAASNSVTPATTPGAPTGVTATSGNASASVTWTAPASTGGATITGYVVTPYLNGTTAQTAQTFNSTATTETVTGLTNGSAYTFTVAAINSVGTGTASAPSNSVTPATTPGAPTIGTATSGNASATVTWTAPASNGGSAITGYVVTPYLNGTTAQTAQTFGTATTETVTGLTNGSAYTFKVAAINGVGTGTQSAASNSVTPATTPGAPTIGTATGGNASASVTWTAPASTGGATITGYVVTPYLNGTTAQTAQTFNSTATTETVTGLTNGSAYTFKVAAINSVGTGAQSAASNSVTPMTVPGAPTNASATSGNTSATVTWTAPTSNGGSAITGYVVTPYLNGTTAQAAQTFNSTATTETVTGLTNGSAYTFTVAAVNSVGTGAASAQSNSVTPATTPGAPTIGTATAGNASATVTWTAPASNGGSAITGYVVTPYLNGTTAQAAQAFGTGLTETVGGLTNGSAYTFAVAAINSVGTGVQSAASNSVTPVTTPGAPTIGTATGGNTSATVTWTAPASTGGATITGYVVTPYLNGTTAQTAQTFNSTATTQTVTGLTNGSAYTFKVAAINSVGTGTQSAASNSVTPATTPGAPTIGTATSGNASATVTWTAPASTGGSAITGYVVTPYPVALWPRRPRPSTPPPPARR